MAKGLLRNKNHRKLFVKELAKKVKDDEVSFLSAQTSYHIIVALVPFLVVALNLILFFLHEEFHRFTQYLSILPEETRSTLIPIIENIINNRSTSIISIGLLVALWSASNGIRSLLRALNKAFDVEDNESFVQKSVKGLIFTIIIIALMQLVMVTIVFGNHILIGIQQYLSINLDRFFVYMFDVVRYVIPLAFMVLGFSLLYKYGPNHSKENRIKFKHAIVGGVIATTGWLIITLAYSYYVSNLSNMSLTYGPLVGIMALFIWINLTSFIIILAAEIVSVYYRLYAKIELQNSKTAR